MTVRSCLNHSARTHCPVKLTPLAALVTHWTLLDTDDARLMQLSKEWPPEVPHPTLSRHLKFDSFESVVPGRDTPSHPLHVHSKPHRDTPSHTLHGHSKTHKTHTWPPSACSQQDTQGTQLAIRCTFTARHTRDTASHPLHVHSKTHKGHS